MVVKSKSSSKSIGFCIPSRALVHSRTMQDVIACSNGYNVNWYFSHGNPIPDCFNIIVEEAVRDKNDYIFIVEDDMKLPHDILKKLLSANVDIALADYPVKKDKHTVAWSAKGEFLYGGVGCVLIKFKVFKIKLTPPYFRTDYGYTLDMEQVSPMGNHGLQDVDFYQQCKWANCSIAVIDTPVGHYYLKEPKLPKYGNKTALEYVVEDWEFK